MTMSAVNTSKDMNRAFVDYIIQDYNKPMGVAAYKTSADMSSGS